MEKFKPFINELIQYYYVLIPDTGCGGHLHIVLDDGNIHFYLFKNLKTMKIIFTTLISLIALAFVARTIITSHPFKISFKRPYFAIGIIVVWIIALLIEYYWFI
jgi:magnesium-transporting ATPase (P-type)